ncbi:MAG: ABC transporter ATP-binding protein [Clostridia bacterium]|nr:ABC transporter ATP-binding protein [Clostridia bacterium]
MDDELIRITDITKSYGPDCVLGPISITVKKGEVVGVIGANGAGKSTLLRIIAGVEKQDAGAVETQKFDPGELGYVPQDLAVYTSLTGRQNLRYWASAIGLYGKRRAVRIKYLLKLVGLSDKADKRVSSYSGGMKRRLNLACALVGDVKLLLLDEPTVGADTASVESILSAIERLKRIDCAVLLVSHHGDEIARVCDRTVELSGGRIV